MFSQLILKYSYDCAFQDNINYLISSLSLFSGIILNMTEEAATPISVIVSDRLVVNDETTPLVENNDSEDDRNAPRDKYNGVYLVFVLVGITTLLPWNFFISLNNFWDYKFRDVNETVQKRNSSVKLHKFNSSARKHLKLRPQKRFRFQRQL